MSAWHRASAQEMLTPFAVSRAIYILGEGTKGLGKEGAESGALDPPELGVGVGET